MPNIKRIIVIVETDEPIGRTKERPEGTTKLYKMMEGFNPPLNTQKEYFFKLSVDMNSLPYKSAILDEVDKLIGLMEDQ